MAEMDREDDAPVKSSNRGKEEDEFELKMGDEGDEQE